MRALIVSYCFGAPGEQALIGCYKRSLRLAVELDRRGHEVVLYCTGREFFHDDLTDWAERQVRFIDIPESPMNGDAPGVVWDAHRATLAAADLDLVILSEAPMAGTLLESTLTAVELGIPVVIIDNTYHHGFVHYYLRMYGAMADGVIMTGPSAFHVGGLPATVSEVAPLIDITTDKGARRRLMQIAPPGRPVVAVVAYDARVEELGINLAAQLEPSGLYFVIVSADPERALTRVAQLPNPLQARVRVIGPPTEALLFGLLQDAKLSIGKMGFLQIVESLTLGTPFVGLHFDGYLDHADMPPVFRPFVHTTSKVDPDESTLQRARQFLDLPPGALGQVHEGVLNGAVQAVDFLERLPQAPRRDKYRGCGRLGFGRRLLTKAIKASQGGGEVELLFARCSFLRRFGDNELFIILCAYRCGGGRQFIRLWGRRSTTPWNAFRGPPAGGATDAQREIYAYAPLRGIVIEKELGEHSLPACVSDEADRSSDGDGN